MPRQGKGPPKGRPDPLVYVIIPGFLHIRP